MDITARLGQRFHKLNPCASNVAIEPLNVKIDGHGTYVVSCNRGSKPVRRQVFVNSLIAKILNQGKVNPNLDSRLTL